MSPVCVTGDIWDAVSFFNGRFTQRVIRHFESTAVRKKSASGFAGVACHIIHTFRNAVYGIVYCIAGTVDHVCRGAAEPD